VRLCVDTSGRCCAPRGAAPGAEAKSARVGKLVGRKLGSRAKVVAAAQRAWTGARTSIVRPAARGGSGHRVALAGAREAPARWPTVVRRCAVQRIPQRQRSRQVSRGGPALRGGCGSACSGASTPACIRCRAAPDCSNASLSRPFVCAGHSDPCAILQACVAEPGTRWQGKEPPDFE